MDDAVTELLTLPAHDRRRYTSKLSRAIALAQDDKEDVWLNLVSMRRLWFTPPYGTLEEADALLWDAFVALADNKVADMYDLLCNVLARNPDAYLIPPAYAWLEARQERVAGLYNS
jgi:hypothetical protein